MAYTDIDKPSDYFETVLYAGNGGTQSITSLDFQPDWIWCKERGTVDDGSANDTHAVFDSVRGATKRLIPNGTNAEGTQSNGITSFNSNGFTSGDANITNGGSSRTYASWNWKAGTSFTNDASGTGIGSIDSAGSVNTDAGFSIISYTGTGSAATVAHGLGSAPRMIIIKDRSNARNWGVYHQSMGNLDAIYLDLTNAKGGNSSAFWNSTSPTSSVFSINTRNEVNASSANMIAYCFAEKKGYSKFGSYTGNGNANGTFVYTGFKPAMIIRKVSSTTGGWLIHDSTRTPFNGLNSNTNGLRPNTNEAEFDYFDIDYLSNGFKLRTSESNHNASGATFIYMAFASNPFTTSTGVPATAR
jgi:hypothetical protein